METIQLYIQKYVQYRKRKVFGSTGKVDDLLPSMVKHKTEKISGSVVGCTQRRNHEPVGFQEAYPQGSGNVPHREQRFQERREVRLRHADFLQPLGYTGFAEKLP